MFKKLSSTHPLRIFWFSCLITLFIAGVVFHYEGLVGLWLFTVLLVLEVTFSFDNAVVNSKVLKTMSPFWQKIFLTIGIFIAVFVVRFLLPVFIVMLAGGQGFMDVIDMAFNESSRYGEVLHKAAPMIDAFGGAFLLMIGLSYFIDRKKDIHWISAIESRLAKAGRFENFKICLMLLIATILYFSVDTKHQSIVLIASVLGILLHIGLELASSLFIDNKKSLTAKKVTGLAAFTSFIYLEVLDASFSFDGVIGAFAITSSVVLIIAGLGAGAMWVRSLTMFLLKTGTLEQYKYLEHGAHWAIMALGIMMVIKLFHVEPPEWITGGIGIVFIATAIVSSVIERRHSENITR